VDAVAPDPDSGPDPDPEHCKSISHCVYGGGGGVGSVSLSFFFPCSAAHIITVSNKIIPIYNTIHNYALSDSPPPSSQMTEKCGIVGPYTSVV
jgi:hypothetical protein